MLEEKETTTSPAEGAAPDKFTEAVEKVAAKVGADAAALEAAILEDMGDFLNFEEEEEEPADAEAKRAKELDAIAAQSLRR